MRAGVLVFPGSCDDRDALHALRAVGAEAVPVAHDTAELPALDAGSEEEAERIAREVAERVLANALIERFDVVVHGAA